MLQITNLSKSYGSQPLFKNVSFTINKKERVGLVGRNGHGKSTLFYLIQGREHYDSGSISIPKNYRISSLDQHIRFSMKTALQEVCLGLHGDHEHDTWRVEKVLTGLGFSMEDMERHPSEFSSGFQLRLNLAKVLVSEPDLMLLDEPNNYLDILSIRWLISCLRSWKNELIVITHDRSFMDSVTTHTMAIHRQKIKKIAGTTEKLYNQIAKEEEEYEKKRVIDEKKQKKTRLFISRFRAKARLAGMVQSRIKMLDKNRKRDKLEKIESLEFSFNAAPFEAKRMMVAERISFSYEGKGPFLIKDLNIVVNKNDRIGVIGKNGKGKSTLLKLLAAKLSPIAGQISTHPELKVGYFGEADKIQLDSQKTVVEEVMSSDRSCGHQKARDIIGSLMFEGDMALKTISVLSGGERSRVLLGKILVTPSHLIFLDEPTNHLDVEACDSLIAAIDSFEGAIVFVTHNEMYLRTLANRLIVFDRGKVTLFEGGYQDFLDRIGWESDELSDKLDSQEGKNQNISRDIVNKKELRKIKAEILREKTRILNPLKTQIKKIETKIEELEEKLTKNTNSLIRASERGDGEKISSLSKSNHEIKSQIDGRYETLDELTRTFEQQSKKFEIG